MATTSSYSGQVNTVWSTSLRRPRRQANCLLAATRTRKQAQDRGLNRSRPNTNLFLPELVKKVAINETLSNHRGWHRGAPLFDGSERACKSAAGTQTGDERRQAHACPHRSARRSAHQDRNYECGRKRCGI